MNSNFQAEEYNLGKDDKDNSNSDKNKEETNIQNLSGSSSKAFNSNDSKVKEQLNDTQLPYY